MEYGYVSRALGGSGAGSGIPSVRPVSYTHLDVYKRQGLMGTALQSLYKNYDAEGKDPDSLEWKSYPIPSLDGEKETTPIIYDLTNKYVVVKAGYEHPEAVTKMVNYIHFMGIGPQEKGPEGHPELAITYEEYQGIEEDGTNTTNGLWDAWGNNLFAGETIHANTERWTNWFKIINDNDAEAKEWCENNLLARDGAVNIQAFAKDGRDMVNSNGVQAVSYTHLDVYKRQG